MIVDNQVKKYDLFNTEIFKQRGIKRQFLEIENSIEE